MEVLIPCYKNSFISQYKTLRSCFIQTPHDPLIYVSILSLSDPGGALPAGDLGLVQNCGGRGGEYPRGLWKVDELRRGWGHPEDVMVYTISRLFSIFEWGQ